MKYRAILPALLSIAFAGSLHASLQSDIGFTELKQQFGTTLPTGDNINVLMVEAPDGSGNWAVAKSGELSTRSITYPLATSTPTTYSSHANTVAKNLTGVTTSILPGLSELKVASVASYRSNSLHMGFSQSPEPTTWDVENHSLVSDVSTFNLNTLWLLDYRIARDGVTVVIALENGTTNAMRPLWGNNYNTIAVGTATGSHTRGGTNLDGSGRMKPDLVGTATYTSYATPVVTSAAGLLIAEAKRTPALAVAKDPRTVKALLMAGATKEEFPTWSHTAAQPLDPIYGAGQVNIQHSYISLVSGRITAGSTMETPNGWDLGTSGTKAVYSFTVPAGQTLKFSTALTWYRVLATSNYWNFSSSLADLNLRLRDVGTNSVVAESTSALDNVEHIYATALPAGSYSLEVVGNAGTTYGLAWYGELSGSSTTPVVTSPTVVAPSITAQPVSLSVQEGQPASFSITASGDSLTYQWCNNGTMINGATGRTYSIPAATTSCAGNYCVTVANSAGAVTSNEVALVVAATPVTQEPSADLADLSVVAPLHITARGENLPNEGAAKLVDGSATTKWLDFKGTTWVQLELATPTSLAAYSLTSANDADTRDPYNWTVKASNDGATWTTVDSRSAETFSSRYLQRDFVLTSATATYRFFRFEILCKSGYITQLAELALRTASTSTETPSTPVVTEPPSTDISIAELTPITVTARGENAPKETKANLFDHKTATKWLDFKGTTWVQVELADATSLISYSLTSANDYDVRDPYNWTVSGSNDGVNWTVVDTRSAETFASRLLQRDFVLATASAAYRFYRLDIVCKSGTITQLAELEIWGATAVASTTTDTAVEQSTSDLVVLTPVTVTARGENAPKETKANLFDQNTATKWLDFKGTTWVQIELATAHQLESYSFTSANDYDVRDPYNWTVYGSSDGVSWTKIEARSAEVFATRFLQRDFVLSQTSASYRFFRFEITCKSGSITQLAELELWGR